MPNVFKATIYICDETFSMINEKWIEEELENFACKRELVLHLAEIQKSGDFEWTDNLPINLEKAETKDFEKYFEWPDVKTFVPGIRPVNDDPDKKAFGPGTPAAKIIPKIIIDTRIYTDDFKTAVDDMRDYIKLGYLCNLTSIKAEYGTTDFKLEVFKR